MTETVPETATDIASQAWIFQILPASWRPYASLMRLDRPVGVWLLLLPCWWSVALAGGVMNAIGLYTLFAIGALVMRAAGCTINDLADRDFDAQVARTATRPIPAGDVSVKQAFAFLAALLFIGLLVLLQMNWFTVVLGASSLILVAAYPFMKRITYWPQAVLGLAFNWGALMGWAAIHEGLSAAPVFLYLAGVSWTLGYDTIYAHQDKADDALIGVKSTALRFGKDTRNWLFGFYGLTVLMLGQAIDSANLGVWAYAGLFLGALHLAWQVYRLDIDDPKGCLRLFKSNRDFGLVIFLGLLLGLVQF